MTQGFVLDTSALIQAFVEDVHTREAVALLSRLGAEDRPELHVLDFALIESANVLWKRVRNGTLDISQAQTALANLESLTLITHSARPYLATALSLSTNTALPVYDTLAISLASVLGLPLVTDDVRQFDSANGAGVAAMRLVEVA